MQVIYTGSASMSYNGKTIRNGETLDVSEGFYTLHLSRLKKVDDSELITDAEFTEIKNVAPEKKATKRTIKKKD